MPPAPPRPQPPHRPGGGRRSWPFGHRGRNRRQRGLPRLSPLDSAATSAAPAGSAAAPPAGPTRMQAALRVLLPLALTVGCGLGVAFAVLAGHRFLTHSPHFALRDFRVSGVRHLTTEELLDRAGVAFGDNLFARSVDQVALRVRADPWVAGVKVHRELPAALAVEVVEREARAVVALGSLYLCDEGGAVFKRATLEEAAALPVLTGVARDAYIHDRDGSQALLREGLQALSTWQAVAERAPIGEVHVEPAAGTTLYARQGGTAIRVGHGDAAALAVRMARVDAVWAALLAAGQRAAIIHADAATHPERVTVRLLAPRRPPPAAPPSSAVAPPPADPAAKN